MTRKEVIMMYDNISQAGLDHSSKVIDFYIKTGMLKVEEEKTVEERVIDAWNGYGTGIGGFGSRSLIRLLDKAGLKIVEKDK